MNQNVNIHQSSSPQQNPVSPTKRSPDEERLYKMYGRLPSRSELLNRKLKDRKFFDSGDYALKQAGKDTTQVVGSEHPVPEIIPHHTSPPQSRHASFSYGSATAAHDPSLLAAHELDLKLKGIHRSSIA